MREAGLDESVIELKGISKSFGSNVAVDNVSLSLQAGHFYALLGQNGAGKSTLIKILMRHIAPDSGDGHILGIPLWENSAAFNAQVGFASEAIDYAVPYSMDEIFGRYAQIYSSWDAEFFQKIIADLSLNIRKRFGELSRGQRMQVAIAVAMSIRPQVILLDEVTSVLDAGARSYFMQRLAEFTDAGGTVVMATNVVAEIHHVADWLIFVEGGRLKFLSRAEEVSAGYRRIRRPRRFDHEVFRDPSCVEIGIGDDDTTLYLLPADRVSRYRFEAEILDQRSVTAEEVFIYLTKTRGES